MPSKRRLRQVPRPAREARLYDLGPIAAQIIGAIMITGKALQ